ncbi:ABC transporter permease [Staphylococcus caprae]|nr:ABC transporter permease [Staphylococcus caprae]MBX5320324.1 ABC transporter permease [Staphylococcus caprae]
MVFKVNSTGKIKVDFYSNKKITDNELRELKQNLVPLQQIYTISKHNLNEKTAQKLYQNSTVNSHILNKDGNKLSSSERNFNTILSYALLVILVFILMNYINQISMEIANEKTSRVIEMIITSVPAYQHVLSKIIGVILVALTQILILVFTFFISYKFFDGDHLFDKFDLDVTSENIDVIIIALIVWLLAIIGYIILGALVGSLVSRIEDLGQAIMPLSLVILVSFYIAFFNFSTPDSKILRICSYIPYISPFAILAQLSGDSYSIATIISSIVINIIVILISLIIVSKSFKSTILSFDKSLLSNFKRILGK